MRAKFISIIALWALGAPAIGQVTTRCASYQGSTNCVSTEGADPYPTSPGASAAGRAIGAWLSNRQTRRQQQEAYAEDQARRSDQALVDARRRAAAQMIADGKCDEARDMALKASDLDLVAQIKAAC